MMGEKVCVFTGRVGAKEFAWLEKYAMQGCTIAFMDRNKEVGKKVQEELERSYQVPVFFFHGDIQSEEDRDLFTATVQGMYGGADYIICNDK